MPLNAWIAGFNQHLPQLGIDPETLQNVTLGWFKQAIDAMGPRNAEVWAQRTEVEREAIGELARMLDTMGGHEASFRFTVRETIHQKRVRAALEAGNEAPQSLEAVAAAKSANPPRSTAAGHHNPAGIAAKLPRKE
jgi:hypothetical protein